MVWVCNLKVGDLFDFVIEVGLLIYWCYFDKVVGYMDVVCGEGVCIVVGGVLVEGI